MTIQFTNRSFLIMAVCGTLAGGALCDTSRAADQASRQAAAEQDRERTKWENKIVFYGEEEVDAWSLRVQDPQATERAKIKYTELWKLDPATKLWVKIDNGAPAVTIVPAKEKPADAPESSQLVADLPLKQKDVGLYYAKWKVNDAVEGATFCRVGPGLVGDAARKARENPMKVPPGMTLQIVPLTIDKAELMTIPDPRFGTGQAMKIAPTTRPK